MDEFRSPLAVADDELRELAREGCEGVLEDDAVGERERFDRGAAGGAVGEEGDGVVGGGIAVDGDGVKGAVDGVGEEGRKGGGGDGGIGGEDTKEGGHIRVDHAGAYISS